MKRTFFAANGAIAVCYLRGVWGGEFEVYGTAVAGAGVGY